MQPVTSTAVPLAITQLSCFAAGFVLGIGQGAVSSCAPGSRVHQVHPASLLDGEGEDQVLDADGCHVRRT